MSILDKDIVNIANYNINKFNELFDYAAKELLKDMQNMIEGRFARSIVPEKSIQDYQNKHVDYRVTIKTSNYMSSNHVIFLCPHTIESISQRLKYEFTKRQITPTPNIEDVKIMCSFHSFVDPHYYNLLYKPNGL